MPDRLVRANGVKLTVRAIEASPEWARQFLSLVLGSKNDPDNAMDVAGANPPGEEAPDGRNQE